MNTLIRIVQGCVIAGFLSLSTGCIVAPDHGEGRGDREVHDHDHDHDRHCDEHDDHCRER